METPHSEGIAMALRRICKSGGSGNFGECPAVYLEQSPTMAVAQGPLLGSAELAALQELGGGEGAVRLPTETLLRAAALILAELGRPAMLDEVEALLSEWSPAA
jgi:hypothetical protein